MPKKPIADPVVKAFFADFAVFIRRHASDPLAHELGQRALDVVKRLGAEPPIQAQVLAEKYAELQLYDPDLMRRFLLKRWACHPQAAKAGLWMSERHGFRGQFSCSSVDIINCAVAHVGGGRVYVRESDGRVELGVRRAV